MTPGQDKLRSLGRRLDLQQKCLNTVSALEGLPRNLLFRRKKSFCLSKINNIIPAFMPQNYSVDNLSLPVYEILVHCIPFSFSDLLKNNLLCCLRSYPAKIAYINQCAYLISHLSFTAHVSCFIKRYLFFRVCNLFHYFLD